MKAPQLCVYCQKRSATERDHIPPKNLFPPPRPSTLITVPACSSCNRSASLDDEYLRLVVVGRWDVYEHPDARKLMDHSFGRLAETRKTGLRKGFFAGVREVDIRSETGDYLGQTAIYDVDLSRLDRVGTRIVRGLVYHHTESCVPADHSVEVFCWDGLSPTAGDARQQFRSMATALQATPQHIIGNDVFSYWYQVLPDCPTASVWYFRYFNRIEYLGTVVRDVDVV